MLVPHPTLDRAQLSLAQLDVHARLGRRECLAGVRPGRRARRRLQCALAAVGVVRSESEIVMLKRPTPQPQPRLWLCTNS